MNKQFKIILYFLLPCLIFAESNPIHTINPKYTGESHSFTALYLSRFGEIYTIDQLNNGIYLLNKNGDIINSVGGFGWTKGLFDKPTNISSPDGLNIYISDYNNQRIALYDRQLNFISVFPKVESREEQFYPLDVAVSDFEKIFILDDENKEILSFSQEGELINKIGGIDYGAYALNDPLEMIILNNNEIAVLEKNRLLIYSIYGKPLDILQLPDHVEAESFCAQQDLFVIVNNSKLYFYNRSTQSGYNVELSSVPPVKKISDCCLIEDKVHIMTSQGEIFVYRIAELSKFKEAEESDE